MNMKIEPDEKSLKEQIPYPDMTFPFCVWPDVYNLFDDCTVNTHWHYDFEYGYVLSGPIDYYINDTFIRLETGDCIFVNSNMLHMSRQPKGCNNAVMFAVTFPPTLLTSDINSTIYQKYFQPIIDTQMEGFKIASNNSIGLKIATLLLELLAIQAHAPQQTQNTMPPSYWQYYQLIFDSSRDEYRFPIDSQIYRDITVCLKDQAKTEGYEFECMKRVMQVLLFTLQHMKENKSELLWHTDSLSQTERAKGILAYIHTHFAEKITVEDIAKHMSISRSECFRCFKRFSNKRPLEYINEYRLTKAAKLLKETETSITVIASNCGFESASYFSKTFKQNYAMTPVQYRKQR